MCPIHPFPFRHTNHTAKHVPVKHLNTPRTVTDAPEPVVSTLGMVFLIILCVLEGTKRATSAGSRPSSGRPPRPPSAATRRILEELAQESLDVVEDTAGNTSVRALTYIEVSTVAEASMFLSGGTSLRATAATEQNDVSSRSHTVFTISVINCGPDSASSTLPGAQSMNFICECHLQSPLGSCVGCASVGIPGYCGTGIEAVECFQGLMQR